MAKKDYKSPKMQEVNVQVESLMQSASTTPGGCPAYTPCSGDCTDDT